MDDDLAKEIRVRRVTGLALLGLGLLPLTVGLAIALVTDDAPQGLRGLVLGGILTIFGAVQVVRWRLAVRSAT